ncbi:MAG: tRNA preQ1(34) S-adenosylmethionine ribosyltransferase-isomerase QueA [Betaproteobacteria bacterium]|nr:tRNA preQ1(34) S-adenosylmethionine ribosyltransferase-isomerase QueA [Betaproteobacteria bacterium]
MRLQDFDFDLPAGLIAQHPAPERSASRLLRVHGNQIADCMVRELPALLDRGDLLVFNDTRVMKARLLGRKHSGGQVEVLIERILNDKHALAQIRASHAPKPGGRIIVADDAVLEVSGAEEGFYVLDWLGEGTLLEMLERHGKVPVPPYITRAANKADEARYQTVYARAIGAVAAPTAGLHFDQMLLERLAQAGVRSAFLTLHVGAGTFQPIRVQNLDEHRMHTERYEIAQELASAVEQTRRAGNKVVAVGTTTLRALESAAMEGELHEGARETSLFIRPGFRFRIVDRLFTNFHLPKSSLLVLVSAFSGHERIRRAYAHAVGRRYRFFSYGDAMLLERDA